jgi:peptide deformylase
MPLPILFYDSPLLRKKAVPVAEITAEIRSLVAQMIETVDLANGIGLAAPQIGKSLRLFILRKYIHNPDGSWNLSDPHVYINPEILEKSIDTEDELEGCLSIPGLKAPVTRPVRVQLKATDLDGNTFIEEEEGYNARVIFHENDHLNGVLFIDRLSPAEKRKIEPLLRKLKESL